MTGGAFVDDDRRLQQDGGKGEDWRVDMALTIDQRVRFAFLASIARLTQVTRVY